MTRFDDYNEVIADGAGQLVWKHELVAPDGRILATTEAAEAGDAIHWGASMPSLQSQSNRVSQRTANLTVPLNNNDLLPSPGRVLHPDSQSKVRTSAGIVKADGTEVYQIQSTMAVEQVTGSEDSGAVSLDIELVDPLRVLDTELVDAFQFDDDEPVGSIVSRLAAQALDSGAFTISGVDDCTVTGGGLRVGANRYTTISALLEGCGHELTATPNGQVYNREILPSWDDESLQRWRYGVGGIPIDSARRVWRSRVPQAWKIEGGSFRSTAVQTGVVVYDGDPASEGYFRPGSTTQTIGTTRLPWVEVVTQSIKAGYAQLRRHGTGPGIVTFWTIPNPFIQEGDIVELELPVMGQSSTYRVLDYQLPPQGGALMQVVCRAVYDPALDYTPGNDRGDGCVATITDPFDRSDQNLENLEGSPGSEDWTEVGFSWYIMAGVAIQRYPGWSLAFLNTPLCSANQSASIEVGVVPAGRSIGPAVRSTGEFDGYTAQTNPNGYVTLEMWLNKQRVRTLGAHNAGGSIEGRTLAVSAAGRTITASINGEVVITAEDDSRTGTHVGMVAYGGPTGDAPGARSFTAGATA